MASSLGPLQGLVALRGNPGNDSVALAIGVAGALWGPVGPSRAACRLSMDQLGAGKFRLDLLQPVPCLAQLAVETPEVGGELADAVLATLLHRTKIGRLSRVGDGAGRCLPAERTTLAPVAFSEMAISVGYAGA